MAYKRTRTPKAKPCPTHPPPQLPKTPATSISYLLNHKRCLRLAGGYLATPTRHGRQPRARLELAKGMPICTHTPDRDMRTLAQTSKQLPSSSITSIAYDWTRRCQTSHARTRARSKLAHPTRCAAKAWAPAYPHSPSYGYPAYIYTQKHLSSICGRTLLVGADPADRGRWPAASWRALRGAQQKAA